MPMTISLTTDNRLIAKYSFEHKDDLKARGYKYNGEQRAWISPVLKEGPETIRLADGLQQYLDDRAAQRLTDIYLRATSSPMPVVDSKPACILPGAWGAAPAA